jgi:hypothetical protein
MSLCSTVGAVCDRAFFPSLHDIAGARKDARSQTVTDPAYNHSMRFARHFIRPDAESAE